MSYRKDWVRLIRALAPRYGVDPRAALAVASAEGLSGGRGDQGTSAGPFQLHRGGALPSGRDYGWAESPAGIEYALREIGKVAGGLHGQSAISNIVSRFERPADPRSEIARALASYGKVGGGDAAAVLAAPKGQQDAPAPNGSPDLRMALASQLASGRQIDWSGLAQQQAATVQQSAPQQQQQQQQQPRPEQPPNTLAAHVVKFAAGQLGQPYVWGGESRKEGGFDCSGLVDYALRSAGVKLPGRLTTYSAMHLGQSVKGDQPQPGDMVIVNHGKHMVLYVGNGQVIAAPHKGAVVEYQPLSRFAGSIVDVRRL